MDRYNKAKTFIQQIGSDLLSIFLSCTSFTVFTQFLFEIIYRKTGHWLSSSAPSARQVWSALRAVAEGPRKRPVRFAPTQFDLPDRFAVLLSDAQSPEPLRQQNRTDIGPGHARLTSSVDAR